MYIRAHSKIIYLKQIMIIESIKRRALIVKLIN